MTSITSYSLVSTKFFNAKAKFTFVELGKTREYLGEDLYVYVKWSHKKALDYSDNGIRSTS